MKAAVIHVNSCNHNAFVATTRICKAVSDALRIPMISNKYDAALHGDEFDIVFLKSGILLFCDFRDQLFSMLEKAGRVIVIDNDYAFKMDKRILSRIEGKMTTWNSADRAATGHKYINWNRVGWFPVEHFKHEKKGLFYYGACRKDRHADFKKYFGGTCYRTLLACDSRNQEMFQSILPVSDVEYFERWSHPKQLTAFDHAIYIEDATSHILFTSPAQRFYEYVSAGVAVIIDSACIATFQKAGIAKADQFAVNGAADVSKVLQRDAGRKLAAQQMRLWKRDYIGELKTDIKKLWKEEK